MKDQDRGGHIFNMDGAGADGGATPRFAAYGATKRCLSQLGTSLQAELADVGTGLWAAGAVLAAGAFHRSCLFTCWLH